MKSLKFASIILLFVLSCSKKEDLKLTDTSQLFGRWTFVKIYGDTYGTSYNVSEKSKNVIEFTQDAKYIESRNDTIIKVHNYTLTKSTTNNNSLYYLNFEDSESFYIYFNKDELDIQYADVTFGYKKN